MSGGAENLIWLLSPSSVSILGSYLAFPGDRQTEKTDRRAHSVSKFAIRDRGAVEYSQILLMIPRRDQPNIEPLTTTFYYVSTKMGPLLSWTNNRIEPLSGDPLSGLDCTFYSTPLFSCPIHAHSQFNRHFWERPRPVCVGIFTRFKAYFCTAHKDLSPPFLSFSGVCRKPGLPATCSLMLSWGIYSGAERYACWPLRAE